MKRKIFNNLIKNTLCILLSLVMVFSLASCDAKKDEVKIVGSIIDGAGREVGIREDAALATIASVYSVAVPFFVALGLTDRVLAVNVKSSFWNMANKDLDAAGTVGRGTVDLEKLASFAPTALVHRSNDPETVEAVSKLGIDVICITVENIDDIKYTLSILGKYFGKEDRVAEVTNWIDKKFAYIDSIVERIPQSERKTALLMGGELGRVAGDDMLQTWMIKKAGGIPVVDAGKNHNWINIGVEKVFEYNPDVMFCTSSASRNYKTEEILGDGTWSAMTCVKNNDIYIVPTALDSWDQPGISCILGTLYMLREMYPEYLSVDDFEDQVDDYYRFMFGRCFDKELEIDWNNF